MNGISDQPVPPFDLAHLDQHVGRELGVSAWHRVDQASINEFGRLTLDPDPNHIDEIWAADHSPFGGTVAFGFQTLAYLTYLGKSAGMIPAGVAHEINYGFEHVRFIAPVPAGSRIRARVALKAVRRRDHVSVIATFSVAVEIEGRDRPVLVADWLALLS